MAQLDLFAKTFIDDTTALHNWVQGDENTTVNVTGGPLDSPRKLIKQWNAAANQASDGVLAQAVAAKNAAQQAASDATSTLSGAAKKSELALPETGAPTIAYQLLGTGTYGRTLREYFSEEVRLFDFIPPEHRDGILSGTSTYDASDDIARAISFCSLLPNGTELVGPRGEFLCTKSILWKNKVRFKGKGKRATVFKFTNAGAGFKSNNPINSSTGAYTEISHCAIVNNNASNTDGGFVDVGGTFVDIHHVRFQGWKYQVILDQTEVSTVLHSEFGPLGSGGVGGIWLVNGPSYSPGAANAFTNQISVNLNQFNTGAGTTGIIDDGGVGHNLDYNNFNGGARAMRLAGARVVSACRNEIEYCTSEGILFTGTRHNDGTGVGQCFDVAVEKSFFIANPNTPCVRFVNGTNITLRSNDYQATGGPSNSYALVGCQNVNNLIEESGPATDMLGIIDVMPVKLFQTSHPDGIRMTRSQFYSPVNTATALETYCPSSAGGGTAIGGMDLSGDNAAGTKIAYARIRPAIYGNAVGAETGALRVEVAVNGVPTSRYTFTATNLFPTVDNSQSLGLSNARWQTVWSYGLNVATGTAPASSSAAGVAGEIRMTDDYIYRCIATNTWRRAALTSW